jgi:proline iminopeptidase
MATTPVPLYWAEYGEENGARWVVVHGGPGAHHDYLLPQLLRLIRPGRRLFFYDQRGGGRSRTDDREPVGWRTHVDDLASVLREIGEPRPFFVGYSWGALLVMLYAIEQARGVDVPAPRGLVLIDPAPISRAFRTEFETEFTRRMQGADVKRLREELAASGLRDTDPERYRQRAFELSVAGYFADPGEAHDLTPFRVTGRVQESVWASLGDFDLTAPGLLDRVRLPALVIHGREDPIPLASSEAAARALGAPLVVLDGSGHVPYVETPDALFAAIEKFAASHEP